MSELLNFAAIDAYCGSCDFLEPLCVCGLVVSSPDSAPASPAPSQEGAGFFSRCEFTADLFDDGQQLPIFLRRQAE